MSALSQFRDTAVTFLNVFGNWFENLADVEDQTQTVQNKESNQFEKATDKGKLVGKAAERMVQNLAIAMALEKKQTSAIEARARQALAAREAGDTLKEAEHAKVGAMLSFNLKSTQARIVHLKEMAAQATENQEAINTELQRQARKLAQRFEDDQMNILEYRMAEGMDELIDLQKMVYNALPGDRDNMRVRIEERVQDRIAETKAASKMWDKIWEDKKLLAETEDLEIAIEGEEAFKQIAAGVGYELKALPAPGQTTVAQ